MPMQSGSGMMERESMKTTVLKKELERALKFVMPAVSKERGDDLEGLAKLEVSGGMMKITAGKSGYQRSAMLRGQGSNPADGAVLVDARSLLRTFSGNGTVEITATGKRDDLTVTVREDGLSENSLVGKSAKSFPVPPIVLLAESHELKLSERDIAAIAAVSKWSADNLNTRYYLEGVAFQKGDNGKAIVVATEGHGLLAAETDAEYFGPSVIVPSEMISAFKATRVHSSFVLLLPKAGTGRAWASWDDGDLEYEVQMRAIDASYPDWRRIIPDKNDRAETVRISDLAGAIKAASIRGSKAGATGAKFERTPESDSIIVSVVHDGLRRSSRLAATPDNGFGGDFPSIGFDPAFILRFCDAFKLLGVEDQITLRMRDDSSPVLIETSRPDVVAILMPMRI
jgi:DNA polymerase-3 subunit beta